MSSIAIVNLDDNESAADYDAEGRTKNSIVIPADSTNNPYSSGHSQGYDH